MPPNRLSPMSWALRVHPQLSSSSPSRHIEALQEKRAAQTMDFGIDAAIQNALEDSARSSPELAEHAVAYGQRLSTVPDTPQDVLRSRTNAIVSAAMILARDGADALLDQHEDWARDVFAQAFAGTDDITVSPMSDGISFNPVAIAALGFIHLWRRRGHQADRDALLELAGRDAPTLLRASAPALQSSAKSIHVSCRHCCAARWWPRFSRRMNGTTQRTRRRPERRSIASAWWRRFEPR